MTTLMSNTPARLETPRLQRMALALTVGLLVWFAYSTKCKTDEIIGELQPILDACGMVD